MGYKSNAFKNGIVKRFLCLEPAALLISEKKKKNNIKSSIVVFIYVKVTLSYTPMTKFKGENQKFHVMTQRAPVCDTIW